MRNTRIFTSIVLTTIILLTFTVTVSAEAQVVDLCVQELLLDYLSERTAGTESKIGYKSIIPTEVGGEFHFSGIEGYYNDDTDGLRYNLTTMWFAMYPNIDDFYLDFQLGYIYTIDLEIRMPKTTDFSKLTFEFGLIDSAASVFQSLAPVNIKYEETGSFMYVYLSSTFEVTESFSYGALTGYEEWDVLYGLKINCPTVFASRSSFNIRSITQTQTKSIGENAYYQASLDAITNMPESEYGYIYNSMPDSEGEIDVVQGELIDILTMYDSDIQQLVKVLKTEQARPCIYLPEVHIPFLDVHVWDNHIFYVDEYLNSMNTQIMVYLETFLGFIRFVLAVTFATYTVYKMSRIEWWY